MPLLVVVAAHDKVCIGKVLLVDVSSKDAFGTFRSSSISVVVVDVESLLGRTVSVGLNDKPASISPTSTCPPAALMI